MLWVRFDELAFKNGELLVVYSKILFFLHLCHSCYQDMLTQNEYEISVYSEYSLDMLLKTKVNMN